MSERSRLIFAGFSLCVVFWAALCGLAFGQSQHFGGVGRPFYGIAIMCAQPQPGAQPECIQLRSRFEFSTEDACVSAMPPLLDQQAALILARHPRAIVRVDWSCVVAEGVYDS